jgi:hypothetical protein
MTQCLVKHRDFTLPYNKPPKFHTTTRYKYIHILALNSTVPDKQHLCNADREKEICKQETEKERKNKVMEDVRGGGERKKEDRKKKKKRELRERYDRQFADASPPCPDRLWGPPSLIFNGYQGLFPWG